MIQFKHRRITPGKYYQINVGDVLKFGSSTRLFILQGPAELQPEEYTSDNLQRLRLRSQLRSSRVKSKIKKALLSKAKNASGEGISWGFDADAEDDDSDDEYDAEGFVFVCQWVLRYR